MIVKQIKEFSDLSAANSWLSHQDEDTIDSVNILGNQQIGTKVVVVHVVNVEALKQVALNRERLTTELSKIEQTKKLAQDRANEIIEEATNKVNRIEAELVEKEKQLNAEQNALKAELEEMASLKESLQAEIAELEKQAEQQATPNQGQQGS